MLPSCCSNVDRLVLFERRFLTLVANLDENKSEQNLSDEGQEVRDDVDAKDHDYDSRALILAEDDDFNVEHGVRYQIRAERNRLQTDHARVNLVAEPALYDIVADLNNAVAQNDE